MNLEIRVSTESGPWRRKFSRCSCQDSNPGPFNHESDALTTELSLLPEIMLVLTWYHGWPCHFWSHTLLVVGTPVQYTCKHTHTNMKSYSASSEYSCKHTSQNLCMQTIYTTLYFPHFKHFPPFILCLSGNVQVPCLARKLQSNHVTV